MWRLIYSCQSATIPDRRSHGADVVDSPETRETDEATLAGEPVGDWLSGLRVDDWSPAYFGSALKVRANDDKVTWEFTK